MAAMSDFLEDEIVKHVFRTGSFTKPAALHTALFTAAPSDSGGGTEVTGGSYARAQLDPLDANWAATAGGDGHTENSVAITFPTPSANWGLVTHFGFGFMAIFWVATTLNAYRHIRRGDVVAHRAWMLRSYALTLAAVTLRLYLPLSQIAAIEFEAAYKAISWLCWVPNLLVVEWFILARNPAPTPAP